ncbi:MAG: type II toxin-antitoxin system RelE/ParE family toxin [Flavobacteriales bacterium]|nr:type II toxin-antitoxin system RelE/ParE family toxin [Flavobacteriales bacterium]
MARQIVWTAPAEKDRKEILAYWLKRNGTAAYSLKLFAQFKNAAALLSQKPFAGRASDIANIRVWPVASYLVFYEVFADSVVIHHVWDGRRDLIKLKF